MPSPGPFPTLVAGGFSAYIDFVPYEETPYTALVCALPLFCHKTGVPAVRGTANRDTHHSRPDRTGCITHPPFPDLLNCEGEGCLCVPPPRPSEVTTRHPSASPPGWRTT